MEVEPGKTFLDYLNPNSLEIISDAWAEPCLNEAKDGEIFQFERLGYYVKDMDSTSAKQVFNKTVGLRDTWAKIINKSK